MTLEDPRVQKMLSGVQLHDGEGKALQISHLGHLVFQKFVQRHRGGKGEGSMLDVQCTKMSLVIKEG